MAEVPGDAAAAVPVAQRSSWLQFIKSLASMTGDLSSMTAPPFILSPVSLTEYPSYWGERPALFAAIADGPTPEERHIRVTKWFIATLKGQYTTRNDQMGSEKKPLNPVLGELFFGQWPDSGYGDQTLVVEQVSHHPPITAYYIENKTKGLVLQGHNAQKTTFSAGSIIVKQIGHAILTLTLKDGSKETYLLTLPRLRIDSIWTGSPYIELTDSSYVASSAGYVSAISYSGKGYFSGKSHSFKANIYNPGQMIDKATPFIVAEGQWTGTSKTKNGKPFADLTGPSERIQVKPIEEQEPMESRRLWKDVAKGIKEGNFDVAQKEKSKIENTERQKRKDELAAKAPWKLRYFSRLDSDPEYQRLGKLFSIKPDVEDAWVYIPGGTQS